jgi:hypothetical protein
VRPTNLAKCPRSPQARQDQSRRCLAPPRQAQRPSSAGAAAALAGLPACSATSRRQKLNSQATDDAVAIGNVLWQASSVDKMTHRGGGASGELGAAAASGVTAAAPLSAVPGERLPPPLLRRCASRMAASRSRAAPLIARSCVHPHNRSIHNHFSSLAPRNSSPILTTQQATTCNVLL